ncbi:hypothetical protein QFZ24_009959 [Streptomyces phaeochromogenes]|uniref:hypothetical protein n=1 Tax=Streptomyces phaeochromogenes TaxID=1923 RepID=UPI0027940671|nr:hypothetical protein [Streptomyces phaeochromogenes]MDQ0955950.1 hypothetical protein [Streptomyces phaeochromogenes]
MNESFTRREETPAPSGAPRTPFQTPAIDRDPIGPKGSGEGADGVQANFGLGDIWNIAKKVLF